MLRWSRIEFPGCTCSAVIAAGWRRASMSLPVSVRNQPPLSGFGRRCELVLPVRRELSRDGGFRCLQFSGPAACGVCGFFGVCGFRDLGGVRGDSALRSLLRSECSGHGGVSACVTAGRGSAVAAGIVLAASCAPARARNAGDQHVCLLWLVHGAGAVHGGLAFSRWSGRVSVVGGGAVRPCRPFAPGVGRTAVRPGVLGVAPEGAMGRALARPVVGRRANGGCAGAVERSTVSRPTLDPPCVSLARSCRVRGTTAGTRSRRLVA